MRNSLSNPHLCYFLAKNENISWPISFPVYTLQPYLRDGFEPPIDQQQRRAKHTSMKIFNIDQIRQMDAYTIRHEPITSLALMERASKTFCTWFGRLFPKRNRRIIIFCGTGNNGGDGLAIARLLSKDFYEVSVYLLNIADASSKDNQENQKALKKLTNVPVKQIFPNDPFPALPNDSIIVDAILGSGLNKPVFGYWAEFLTFLNTLPCTRVAVDIPSGMFADQLTEGVTFQANHTFSFEAPKLAFFFHENQHRVGAWAFGSIGAHPDFIKNEPSPYHVIDGKEMKACLRPRHRHDHKGTYGHALLIVGSYGKIGAAVLSARACLRSGAGLVTVHAPKCGYEILQIAIPEAMVSVDEHQYSITSVHEDLSKYKAIGIGSGIGTNELTARCLADLLQRTTCPIVLDADALNLLAGHPTYFELIPKGSILTPHIGEFDRMFGHSNNDFDRNKVLMAKAKELGVYLILKGANTAIATPEGSCHFNNTGNPGMATGGSGDVLTGILTGLLAQGYSPLDASQLGVYLHGLAGDFAAQDLQQEALLAGDITNHLGKAFQQIKAIE